MAHTTSKELIAKMLERGVRPEAIHMIQDDLVKWADEFCQPEHNVQKTVEQLRLNPLIPKDIIVHGLMLHPRTGKIEVVVNGYEA